MGTYFSDDDLEDLAKRMSKESLKKGLFICFIGYIGIRLLLWMV